MLLAVNYTPLLLFYCVLYSILYGYVNNRGRACLTQRVGCSIVQSVNRPTRASFFLAFSARQKKGKRYRSQNPTHTQMQSKIEKEKKRKKRKKREIKKER